MVYLTMTSTIVEALEKVQNLQSSADEKSRLHSESDGEVGPGDNEKGSALGTQLREEKTGATRIEDNEISKQQSAMKEIVVNGPGSLEEPSLLNPKLGNPISHGQVIDLSRKLKAQNLSPSNLDTLLRGARIYVPTRPPKPEQTSEYKALMARLRREEEDRSYERMTNPAPPMETFAQRFPMSSAAHAFSSYQGPDPEDEITYAEINRQMALIFNVLVSIVACAGAIWVAARWWSTPARLALSMSGSLLVGVAEVVVYGGYIRRVSEAKGKEKGVQEVKEVLRTWIVGSGEEEADEIEKSVLIEGKQDPNGIKARRRKNEVT